MALESPPGSLLAVRFEITDMVGVHAGSYTSNLHVALTVCGKPVYIAGALVTESPVRVAQLPADIEVAVAVICMTETATSDTPASVLFSSAPLPLSAMLANATSLPECEGLPAGSQAWEGWMALRQIVAAEADSATSASAFVSVIFEGAVLEALVPTTPEMGLLEQPPHEEEQEEDDDQMPLESYIIEGHKHGPSHSGTAPQSAPSTDVNQDGDVPQDTTSRNTNHRSSGLSRAETFFKEENPAVYRDELLGASPSCTPVEEEGLPDHRPAASAVLRTSGGGASAAAAAEGGSGCRTDFSAGPPCAPTSLAEMVWPWVDAAPGTPILDAPELPQELQSEPRANVVRRSTSELAGPGRRTQQEAQLTQRPRDQGLEVEFLQAAVGRLYAQLLEAASGAAVGHFFAAIGALLPQLQGCTDPSVMTAAEVLTEVDLTNDGPQRGTTQRSPPAATRRPEVTVQ